MDQKNNNHFFPVCTQAELEVLNSKEFILYKDKRPYFGFVVQKGEEIFAYANNCPHQGRMLQWKADRFLNKDASRIMCAAHGAMFELHTGICDAGPCVGKRLKPLNCKRENSVIQVSF